MKKGKTKKIYLYYSLKEDSISNDVKHSTQTEHLDAESNENAIVCEEGKRLIMLFLDTDVFFVNK